MNCYINCVLLKCEVFAYIPERWITFFLQNYASEEKGSHSIETLQCFRFWGVFSGQFWVPHTVGGGLFVWDLCSQCDWGTASQGWPPDWHHSGAWETQTLHPPGLQSQNLWWAATCFGSVSHLSDVCRSRGIPPNSKCWRSLSFPRSVKSTTW